MCINTLISSQKPQEQLDQIRYRTFIREVLEEI